MVYFFLTFFSVVILYKKEHSISHYLLISIPVFSGITYLVSLLELNLPFNRYVDGLSLLLFVVFFLYGTIESITNHAGPKKTFIINLLIVLSFLGIFLLACGKSYTLPVHDPVLSISHAKIIFGAGNIPKTLVPFSEEPFTYPPGFGVFISIFFSLFKPLTVLGIYKYLNIIAIALIPAAWAYYLRRIYNLHFLKGYLVLISFYYGYFLLDRSLTLTMAYAGKNAVVFTAFLFPAVFYHLIRINRTIADFILIVLSLMGMFLIHYSFIIMFGIFTFSHLLLHFKMEKNDILKYLSLVIVAVLLLIPQIVFIRSNNVVVEALHGEVGYVYSFGTACHNFIKYLFTDNNLLFWNFSSVGIGWKYKKISMLFFLFLPILHYLYIRFYRKTEDLDNDNAIIKLLTVSFSSITCAVIMSCGFIPLTSQALGTLIQWFSYNFFALLGATFFIFICHIVTKTGNGVAKKGLLIIIFIIIPIIPLGFENDFKKLYQNVNKHKISYDELKTLEAVLQNLSNTDGVCNLLTQSQSIWWNHQIQDYRPLEYHAVISDCRILNGTFFSFPMDGSRREFVLPSRQFYDSFGDEPIYYIGKKGFLDAYMKRTACLSYIPLDVAVGSLGIYKIIKEKTFMECIEQRHGEISKNNKKVTSARYYYNNVAMTATPFNIEVTEGRKEKNKAYYFLNPPNEDMPDTDAYIDLEKDYDNDAVTISLWINPEIQNNTNKVLNRIFSPIISGRRDDWKFSLALSIIDGCIAFGMHGPVYWNSNEVSSQPVSPHNWQHIAAVKKEDIYKIYYNGQPVHAHKDVVKPTYTDSWLIGKYEVFTPYGGDLYSGRMEDIRIFDTALTDEDIEKLYEDER